MELSHLTASPERRYQRTQEYSARTLPVEAFEGDPIPARFRNGRAFAVIEDNSEHPRTLVVAAVALSSPSSSTSSDDNGRNDTLLMYYDLDRERVGRSVENRGCLASSPVALVRNRFLIGEGRSGGLCACDAHSGEVFPLPRSDVADGLEGSAVLSIEATTSASSRSTPPSSPSLRRGLYRIGGSDRVTNAFRFHCLHLPFSEEDAEETDGGTLPRRGEGGGHSRQWVSLPAVRVARSDATAVELDGRLYLVGGRHWDRDQGRYAACRKTEVFDGTRWTEGPDLLVARRNPVVVTVGDDVIVVLGGVCDDDRPVSAVEVWNVRTRAFCIWGNWERPRRDVSAVHYVEDIEEDFIVLFCGGSSAIEKMPIDRLELTPEALECLLPPLPTLGDQSGWHADSKNSGALGGRNGHHHHPHHHHGDVDHAARGLIPPPPVRPNVPVSATVAERCGELERYASKLHVLRDGYLDDMEEAAHRITAAYERARSQALEEQTLRDKSWLAETERLLETARRELKSAQEIVDLNENLTSSHFEKNELSQRCGSPVVYGGGGSSMNNDRDVYEDSIPSQLRCPITLNLMKDPVVAADGNTYDREALEHWFASCSANNKRESGGCKPLSPLTGAELPSEEYFPVHALRDLCRDFERRLSVHVQME